MAMQMMLEATPETRLREEDLAVGKNWVHPDSQLEYEDFHAFLAGKEPLDHWRNDRIRELAQSQGGWKRIGADEREPWEAFFRRRVDYYLGAFDRNGDRLGTAFLGARALDDAHLAFDARQAARLVPGCGTAPFQR